MVALLSLWERLNREVPVIGSKNHFVPAFRTSLILTLALLVSCGDSDHRTKRPRPDAPASLTAVAGSLEVTLTWPPVVDTDSFNFYWDTSPGVTRKTGNRIADVTSGYVHAGLVNGWTYYYVVTSVKKGRESLESTEAWATPENIGILDTSFAGTGIVVHNGAAGGDSGDRGQAVIVDSMGRIVVAGSSGTTAFELNMAIWRFNDDGSFDTSFGGQGWVIDANAAGGGGDDEAIDIVIDPNDRIVVAGYSATGIGSCCCLTPLRGSGGRGPRAISDRFGLCTARKS